MYDFHRIINKNNITTTSIVVIRTTIFVINPAKSYGVDFMDHTFTTQQ